MNPKLAFAGSILMLLSLAALRAGAAEPDTEIRVLPRTRPDRLYQLTIGLPSSYREHPERKYPVIFVTDAYWGFQNARNVCGALTYGKHLPEVLVVGLGYAGENLDYNAMRGDDLSPQAWMGAIEGGGHAERFLGLIEREVIPLLEKEYRADPEHRYLAGGSAGGLFVLYALFTKPALFHGYIAGSPSIDALWNYEREFAASGRTTSARVFISVGENEWTYYRRQIQAFHKRMAAHGYVKGGLEFRRIDRTRHGADAAESFMQGLLFTASPIAPEHGVQSEFMTDKAGRPGFLAAFWSAEGGGEAQLTPAQTEAWRSHEAYLRRMVAEKRIEFGWQTPADVNRRDSTMMFFAADHAAAEALVREDPAVQSGVLTYELIEAKE